MPRVATMAARDAAGHVILAGRQVLMLASNDYLGLSTATEVREAIAASLKAYGTGLEQIPLDVDQAR